MQLSITSHNKIPFFTTIEVNDGESYNPRGYGKFTNATFDSTNGEITINFERSQNLDNIILKYVIIDENFNNRVDSDMEISLDRDETSFILPIKSGYNGIAQFYLLYQGILLDSYKLRISYNK